MKNIQRFLQRAYHFMERIERESKYFPRRLHIFGWNVAVKTFFDGLVPPGKREFYIQAIPGNYRLQPDILLEFFSIFPVLQSKAYVPPCNQIFPLLYHRIYFFFDLKVCFYGITPSLSL